jgi:hypothetical protein
MNEKNVELLVSWRNELKSEDKGGDRQEGGGEEEQLMRI